MTRDRLASLSVLIVDSNPHMTTIVASMLRSIGVRTVGEMPDAERGWIELKTRGYDLLVVDDSLMGTDGIALTRQIRTASDSPSRNMPIIMMSSQPDMAKLVAARDAGITEFLRKPFAAMQLKARIVTSLEAPRAFVEGPDFTGPDRRRRERQFDGNEKRRSPKVS